MVATRTLWRWLPDHRLEVTRAGESCDWARGGAYEALGWARLR